ncbi:MAG: cell division ATP-binding protein FtsE [bacterium]
MISFRDVTRIYENKHRALEDVSLSIERGEFVFLTGASGAGKTTILRHIMMAEKPTEGEVTVVSYSSRRIKRGEIPRLRRKLGVVFQDFRLLSDRSVFENVAFVLRVAGTPKAEIGKRVVSALTSVGLTHRQDALPGMLSGGEKQRVAIARAIVNDPYALLADEPTGNLDPATAEEIFAIFEKVNRAGTAIIVATHDVVRAGSGRYRRIHLDRGRITSDARGGGRARNDVSDPHGIGYGPSPTRERRSEPSIEDVFRARGRRRPESAAPPPARDDDDPVAERPTHDAPRARRRNDVTRGI